MFLRYIIAGEFIKCVNITVIVYINDTLSVHLQNFFTVYSLTAFSCSYIFLHKIF